MGGTAMPAIVSVRSRGNVFILLVVLTVFVVAAALQLLLVLPNHDSLWLLIAAERMLDGGTYTRDFFEVNPPLAILIHAPSFVVAAVSGQDAYSAFVIVSLVYVGASLALLRKVVAVGFPPSSAFQRWLLPIAAVLLLILPGYDFGQREHLFCAFILPYLALHASGAARGVESRGLVVAVSAWACLGLFLKPVLLLLPVLIAVERAVRAGSWRPLFSSDMMTIGVAGMVYAFVVALWFPDYFAVARYAVEFYGVYQEEPLLVALVPVPYVAVGVLLAVFAARMIESREEARMFALLALAAATAAGSVIMQMKGWSYHVLPIEIFVAMSTLMLIVIASNQIRRRATNRAFALAARVAPLLVVALPLQSPGWSVEMLSRQQLAGTELYAAMEPVAAGKRLYVISSRVIVGTPWLAAIEAQWSSRFSCLWLLPGYVAARDNGVLSAARQEQLDAAIRRAVDEDFDRYRPEVVLVDRRDYKHGFERPFEFLDFFLDGVRFATIWTSYSFYKTVDGLDIYLLSEPVDARDSAAAASRARPI